MSLCKSCRLDHRSLGFNPGDPCGRVKAVAAVTNGVTNTDPVTNGGVNEASKEPRVGAPPEVVRAAVVLGDGPGKVGRTGAVGRTSGMGEVARVARWRGANREGYNAYMTEYMREYRKRRKTPLSPS
jgi:hypothetical protein